MHLHCHHDQYCCPSTSSFFSYVHQRIKWVLSWSSLFVMIPNDQNPDATTATNTSYWASPAFLTSSSTSGTGRRQSSSMSIMMISTTTKKHYQSWWSGPAWSLFQTVVIAGRNPSHKCFKVSLPMMVAMIMFNSHDMMKMINNGFCDYCDCCSGLEGPATALVKSVDCSFPPDTWAAFYFIWWWWRWSWL